MKGITAVLKGNGPPTGRKTLAPMWLKICLAKWITKYRMLRHRDDRLGVNVCHIKMAWESNKEFVNFKRLKAKMNLSERKIY